jgi:hypothetical protein
MDSVDDHPDGWGFPIRKSSDQSVLATPRSLSQPATSFIASQCQGIRQTPLLCLISQRLSAKRRSCDRRIGSFRAGDDPRHDGLVYLPIPSTLPRRQSEEYLDFQTSSDERCQRTRRHIRGASSMRMASWPSVMMVEADGIEPTTSCLQSRRSPN